MFLKKNRAERGQAIVLIALAIVGLVGFTALSIDGGLVFSDRRQAQNAVDTAAMAAALAKIRGNDFSSTALALTVANGYDNNGTSNIVAITTASTPTGECPDTGTDITVTITSNIDTVFAPVVGREQMTNIVSATSRACDVHTVGGSPLYNGSSVFATKSGTCNGANGSSILVSGSSHVQIWGGNMGSASTDGSCLRFQGGEAQLKKEESGTACADVITAASSGGTFTNLKGEDGCGNVNYGQTFDAPPADLGITCTGTATKTGSSMSPGNYTGTFPPSGVETLSSGTYCINGDFQMNGGDKLTATGVTIVMNTGRIQWNGNMEMDISAPTSGPYAGLVVYAPPSNTSQMTINGNGNVDMSGTFLAQNAPCDYVGSGQLQKQYMQFVCYTWQMNGNAQAEIMWDASKLYSPELTEAPVISLLH
ncbi:MAG: Tad domain-containing protein [Anaerolineae bacterium]|jgi:Flp pilus assembly protein TadG|nr:Tad domain-containing protein [Anaerolineae bacterium]MBT7071309.1 Tad domain-containing protein [Anaerolineae bacterium]MBT7325933.1 Tad domain-containing protein [Anaerolineae bacterium]